MPVIIRVLKDEEAVISMVDSNMHKMISMLNNSQPGKGPATKLTFSEKKLREFFPAHYTSTQMKDVIEDLLSDWKHKQDFEGLNGE